MRSFEWIDATSVQQAAALLEQSTPERPVLAKAGGLDLLDLMKEGIVAPARVINLQGIESLRGIRCSDALGLRLGALATLAQIAQHPQIRARYGALAEAAAHAATPQVRNAATIGGNLLQRPRCWYFRSQQLHEASAAAAATGQHQYHAIFDNAATSLVQASTPATALIAYGATVQLINPVGQTREVPLHDLLLPPDASRSLDAALQRGEVLTQIALRPHAAPTRAAYHKQTERDSYDWPICDVAVVLRGAPVETARIVLGWVAPVPRRALESEQLLRGKHVDETLAAQAARAAVAGATPLPLNEYKVAVLEAVVRRTILQAANAAPHKE